MAARTRLVFALVGVLATSGTIAQPVQRFDFESTTDDPVAYFAPARIEVLLVNAVPTSVWPYSEDLSFPADDWMGVLDAAASPGPWGACSGTGTLRFGQYATACDINGFCVDVPVGHGGFILRFPRPVAALAFCRPTLAPGYGAPGWTFAARRGNELVGALAVPPEGGPVGAPSRAVELRAADGPMTAARVTLTQAGDFEAGGGPELTITLDDLDVTWWCVADFDNSGGTPDTQDVTAYFDAWLRGDPLADADVSGGTPDTSDIVEFFQRWLAGGC